MSSPSPIKGSVEAIESAKAFANDLVSDCHWFEMSTMQASIGLTSSSSDAITKTKSKIDTTLSTGNKGLAQSADDAAGGFKTYASEVDRIHGDARKARERVQDALNDIRIQSTAIEEISEAINVTVAMTWNGPPSPTMPTPVLGLDAPEMDTDAQERHLQMLETTYALGWQAAVMRWQSAADSIESDRGKWEDLITERRSAERALLTVLAGTEIGQLIILGAAPGSSGLKRTIAHAVSGELWGSTSHSDDPKIARLLSGDLTPEQVAAAWQDLLDDQSGKYKADELLVDYADVLGALDGIPIMARIEANRNRVPALLGAAEARLAAEHASGADPEVIEYLEHEISYLKQVASSDVQLYLYDPSKSRIIEMIGTPGPETARAVTYVPGTYTGMDSFFTGGVQQISSYLEGSLPGTVAFVYKDGFFPGENHGRLGDPNYFRITEANNQGDTLEAGRQLAAFEAGMRADQALRNVEQVAIGHSWGLANVVSSEEAGVRYDKVISLAGAGMPEGWKPKAGTEYSNLFYYDVLIHAQTKGVVWKGNNPMYSTDFEQHYYFDDRIKGNYLNTGEEFDVLFDNHNRITRDSEDNKDALEDMKELAEQ
ncbi:hypothetical protein [Leucobacter sp. GX24907]